MINQAREVFCHGRFQASLIYYADREPIAREAHSNREPVQNPKPRHFKPFEFFDHTGRTGGMKVEMRLAIREDPVKNKIPVWIVQ
jgi:hypothetical protein